MLLFPQTMKSHLDDAIECHQRLGGLLRHVIEIYKHRLQQQWVLSPRCGHLKGNWTPQASANLKSALALPTPCAAA